MYTTGISIEAREYFTIATAMIGVPTAVKIVN